MSAAEGVSIAGGIGECANWRRRAPAAVLRDLHISGLVDRSTRPPTAASAAR